LNIFTYRPLTEIDFLSKQTLISLTASRTSNGVIVSRIIPAGQTFVLIGAAATSGGTGGDNLYDISLNMGGVLIEQCQQTHVSSSVSSGPYYFISKGRILVGDGVLTIDLDLAGLTGGGLTTVQGSIFGYERNT